MTSESLPIRAESLLQHHEFVRALARSLVRDEHAAQDVVQETWLAALRKPPRNVASIPAWLARVVRTRAQDVARVESSRVARERAVAREELDASEERLRERVALHHRVVEAVLALREPYKTVVLLRYYEGLSPSEIAARRSVPASSVRAQLSRAHDLLRERLDAEFGGSRAAWAVGLAALARGRGGLALGAKLAALGAVAAAAAVPVLLWVTRPASEPATDLASLEPNASLPAAIPIASPQPDPVPVSPSSTRSAMPPGAAPQQIHSTEELESMSVRQLLQIAIHIQQALRTKLLTPSEELMRTYASLLAIPDTGIARVLNENHFGNDESNALGLRGAGSCFSFATHKPDWYGEPDIQLQNGDFQCQGEGPGILDLGERRLEDLSQSPSPIPSGLGEPERSAWETYWADCGLTERGISDRYAQMKRAIGWPRAPKTRIGHAYLVRGITPGGHDVLAAFTPIDKDVHGWTIAWRVLHAWPVPRRGGSADDPYWMLPDPPAAIVNQPVEALVHLFARVRSVARAKLFDVPAELKERFAAFLKTEGSGAARLLSRGRYGPLIDERGEGAYYSFATGKNDYDGEPDLVLERGMYRSSAYGRPLGFLVDLGTIPIESVGTTAGSMPTGLADREQEAWQFAWNVQAIEGRKGERAVSATDEVKAGRLQYPSGVGSQVGHTYLVRSILQGEHDVLAVFTNAASDEHGDWIVYRVIWNRKLAEVPAKR